MSNPLVSIIVPCYDQAQYLDEALESVFDQTYTNWECIIVNDGSPDHTHKVAQKWIAKDSRFVYFYKENGGVSSSRNLGLEKAKGEYIQFLDSDDFLEKEKLNLSLLEMEKDNEVNLVISNFRMFIDNPQITSEPFCNLDAKLFNFETILYEWNLRFSIQIQCGFFHFTLFKAIRFPEKIHAQEDWIVWISIFKAGCRAVFIDKPLALYRKNPSSRMMTKGIAEDQIKVCEYLSTNLSDAEYKKFSLLLISRYYNSNEYLKFRLNAAKKSNSYQTGLMVKKVLKTFGILRLFKHFFPIVLKLKSK